MKVSDEVTTITNEINAWVQTLEQEDRPHIHSAEMPLLVHYVKALKSGDTIVEVGTGWGGSAAIFSKVCEDGVVVYTIDSGSNFDRFGPRDGTTYDDFMQGRFEIYGAAGQVKWIRADSKVIPWEGEINLLFIDGSHSYEGVKGDIENMVPRVLPGCVVIFHDYHMEGVKRAIDEFLKEGGLEIENQSHASVAIRMVKSNG